MTLAWPCKILVPVNVAWNIAPRTLAAPASINGIVQVVASDAGIWKAAFGEVIVKTRTQVLAFRALGAQLEGRLGKVLVPRCGAFKPWPAGVDHDVINGQVPHSDEALFSDDAGYTVDAANAIYATAVAYPRAISISVHIDYGGTIEPGMDFSIGERMYRVTSVSYAGASNATIRFRPPLRESVSVNEPINFDDPHCRMRLLTDDEMDLELALHRYGSPTVAFIEDLY